MAKRSHEEVVLAGRGQVDLAVLGGYARIVVDPKDPVHTMNMLVSGRLGEVSMERSPLAEDRGRYRMFLKVDERQYPIRFKWADLDMMDVPRTFDPALAPAAASGAEAKTESRPETSCSTRIVATPEMREAMNGVLYPFIKKLMLPHLDEKKIQPEEFGIRLPVQLPKGKNPALFMRVRFNVLPNDVQVFTESGAEVNIWALRSQMKVTMVFYPAVYFMPQNGLMICGEQVQIREVITRPPAEKVFLV